MYKNFYVKQIIMSMKGNAGVDNDENWSSECKSIRRASRTR